jgi:hypothetical protein
MVLVPWLPMKVIPPICDLYKDQASENGVVYLMISRARKRKAAKIGSVGGI